MLIVDGVVQEFPVALAFDLTPTELEKMTAALRITFPLNVISAAAPPLLIALVACREARQRFPTSPHHHHGSE
ncbi:hypothetical protein [Paraburkholderia sp.]|uniref:hypothetical protein n=1 Tax=Paraburkholderia sp. TaxID=1926495 RepID=UPI002D5DD9EC|nr:hypothetical protein [Paraburkholderia sp.]HZZ05724.1 hypothetical protein [Paraburkholderia sp.]